MPANVQSRVLDLGLNVLDTEATHLYICNAEPTTYAQATAAPATGYALGSKSFGAGGVFGAPANGTPNGRQVASTIITDGAITATGTASHWAVVDGANSRLLAVGLLAATQPVTSGNTFSLPSFTIRLPNQ